MIVKDLLQYVNVDEQVSLVLQNKADWEETYDKEEIYNAQNEFVHMLLTLQPNVTNEDIIVFEKAYDTDFDDTIYEYITPELYHKEELLQYLMQHMHDKMPVAQYPNNLSSEEYKSLCTKFDRFPQGYAFEFEAWENILGYQVYEKNIDKIGVQECIYSILYEMSFNGMTRESQAQRIAELDEAVEEYNQIKDLPKEEQEQYLHSFDEIKEEWKEKFDWKEPTEEEREEEMKAMWKAGLQTAIWRFNNFKEMSIINNELSL